MDFRKHPVRFERFHELPRVERGDSFDVVAAREGSDDGSLGIDDREDVDSEPIHYGRHFLWLGIERDGEIFGDGRDFSERFFRIGIDEHGARNDSEGFAIGVHDDDRVVSLSEDFLENFERGFDLCVFSEHEGQIFEHYAPDVVEKGVVEEFVLALGSSDFGGDFLKGRLRFFNDFFGHLALFKHEREFENAAAGVGEYAGFDVASALFKGNSADGEFRSGRGFFISFGLRVFRRIRQNRPGFCLVRILLGASLEAFEDVGRSGRHGSFGSFPYYHGSCASGKNRVLTQSIK